MGSVLAWHLKILTGTQLHAKTEVYKRAHHCELAWQAQSSGWALPKPLWLSWLACQLPVVGVLTGAAASGTTPICFMHGVGLGLLPYIPFVMKLAATGKALGWEAGQADGGLGMGVGKAGPVALILRL